MISAATGAMALLVGSLVLEHGIEYLFAATVLAGVFQILMGMLKLGRFITFLPQLGYDGFCQRAGDTDFYGTAYPF